MVHSIEDLKNISRKFGIKQIQVNNDSQFLYLKDELNLVPYNPKNNKLNSLFVDPKIEDLNIIKRHKSRKILILSDHDMNNESLSRYLLKLKSINLSTIYTTSIFLKVRLDRVFIRNRLLKLDEKSNNITHIKDIIVDNTNNTFETRKDYGKVVVALPTYNRSNCIEKRINMMMNQTYKNMILYIIDDGSDKKHKTKYYKLKEKYSSNNKIIFDENIENKHIAYSLNKSINYLLFNNYEYFTWISDDNTYYQNYIEKLVNMKKDFAHSAWKTVDNISKKSYVNQTKYSTYDQVLNKFNGLGSFMWSNNIIKKIGYYNETIKNCEDYEYILRTFKNVILNEIGYTEDCLMEHIRDTNTESYIHEISMMKLKRNIIKYFVENPNSHSFMNAGKVYDDKLIKKIKENNKKKISIVMAYYNRKQQTLETLKGFERIYASKYNFEVVIVDDNSNNENKLDNDIKQFSYPINLIVITDVEKGDRINPCTAYNRGFVEAKGDIIFIQNPEIFHCGDLIECIFDNYYSEIENNYLTFPVFSSPSFKHNNILYHINNDYYKNFVKKINYEDFDFDYSYYIKKYPEFSHLNPKEAEIDYLKNGIKDGKFCNKHNIFFRKNIIHEWKGWYNHHKYNQRNLHFLSLITRKNLNKVGGFCNNFKDGLWYDDDEFLYRIKQIMNVKTLKSDKYFGVHQYHLSGSDDQHKQYNFSKLIQKNKKIFDENIINKVIYCSPFRIGLCFKIFANELTKPERYIIIEEFLESLHKIIENNVNLSIVCVVDCKVNNRLKKVIEKIDTNIIDIIYLNKNYGISYSTNKGIIELLNKGCDYIFCCDDDVIFKKNDIFDEYIKASIEYNITHLSYYPSEIFVECNYSIINDKIRIFNAGYSGCFYMLKKSDILSKGLLPILSAKYGYEHEIFTKTITGKQYDLIYSKEFIELNPSSVKNCSGCKLIRENINNIPTKMNLESFDDVIQKMKIQF